MADIETIKEQSIKEFTKGLEPSELELMLRYVPTEALSYEMERRDVLKRQQIIAAKALFEGDVV